MQLRLVDGIGPFFKHLGGGRINWSKIPFDSLPQDEAGHRKLFDEVREDFEILCRSVSHWGFNAVTLDDLYHLADHAWLETYLREWISRLRAEFRELFKIAARHGLAVYITADVFTASDAVRARVGNSRRAIHAFIVELVDRFLADFPEVDGVIFRIGESDGCDVKGALRSELHVRSASMGRQFLTDLLPVFERYQRKLVFRTWTVGAYPVGDLLWHTATLKRLLKGVNSPALVLSMKHGGSDFFRYLELNPTIRDSPVPTIVEFQAKREYEGAGEFPAFIGNEHSRVREELQDLPHIMGYSVWCQTGGWLPFRRLTFLEPEGVWNEINTVVTAQLMNYPDLTPESIVRKWVADTGHQGSEDALVRLLALSEQVISKHWYVREYAQKALFFRRVRIPPLLWIYWDSIFINHPVKKMLKHLVRDRAGALKETEESVSDLKEMRSLGAAAGVSVEDLEFMLDTGKVIAVARRYFFTKYSKASVHAVKQAKRKYKRRWPRGGERHRLKVKVSFRSFVLSRRQLTVVMALAFRRRDRYRVLDRLVMLQLLSWCYRVFKKRRAKVIPKFARKRAMGVDTVFK